MKYGNTVRLDTGFEEALSRVRAVFKEQGFGILTEIDVKATLKEKIDVDVDAYVILGACNPALANRALAIEPQIGLLLPCNIVVRKSDGQTLVHAVDPSMLVSITGLPELQEVANEAETRIAAALTALTALTAQ